MQSPRAGGATPPTIWQNLQSAYDKTKREGKLVQSGTMIVAAIALPIIATILTYKFNAKLWQSYQFEASRAIPWEEIKAKAGQYSFSTTLHSRIFGNKQDEFAYKWMLPAITHLVSFGLPTLIGLGVNLEENPLCLNYKTFAGRSSGAQFN